MKILDRNFVEIDTRDRTDIIYNFNDRERLYVLPDTHRGRNVKAPLGTIETHRPWNPAGTPPQTQIIFRYNSSFTIKKYGHYYLQIGSDSSFSLELLNQAIEECRNSIINNIQSHINKLEVKQQKLRDFV